MAEIRSFTIEGSGVSPGGNGETVFTSISEGVHNITTPIKAGSTLLLVNSRVDINYGTLLPPVHALVRSINILIGNTVTNFYVVDNNDRLNALKHKLKHNILTDLKFLVFDGTNNIEQAFTVGISDYEPNCAYKIGADMNSRIEISFRDERGQPLGLNADGTPLLMYYFFQFQVL